MNQKSYRIRIFFFIGIITVLTAVFALTPASQLLQLSELLANKERLSQGVQQWYIPSVLIFIALYIGVVALSIPGATVVTLSGGFLFGPWRAVLYINIGATIGASLIFLASRYFLGDMIQKKYQEKLKNFNHEMDKNGYNYLLTLRLIPLFPFFLVNLFSGLSRVPLKTFIWTTSLGIIPGSFAYAYLGYAGAAIEEGKGIPFQFYLAFVFLGLLAIIPVVYKKIRKAG